MELGPLRPERKSGEEPIHADGVPVGASLLEFWRWSGSDLVGNAQRGILAEYLVALALRVAGGIRTEWDAYDLETDSGIKIEVKASGFIQSWKQEKLSKVVFDIAPKLGWDASTNLSATRAVRPADVYVFAVHFHTEQASIDPLDVSQWEFYVVGTPDLEQGRESQKTISLGALNTLCSKAVPFAELPDAVAQAVERRSTES